ncbi:MAG TPA: prolipoprotein diacylglyceryl transferase [Smithellaceae bacterium]|nr:prolipoprotein diacylglyceryl transferase [Smithellaceae bacterium]HRS90251.1 prolipoprotein diacylglyceryl transferase [Smithellaceae bacterium]HRV27080.1 prolipoprotein diacylglyceryl transferase [Smithellaceae bacterium]
MHIEIFILILAFIFAVLFFWAFKRLPREEWQFICSFPAHKTEDGRWRGWNLTYYGLFTALALICALLALLLMMFSMRVPSAVSVFIIAAILVFCLPASRLTARILEKKKYTLSVGGTFFIGILIAPWIIYAADILSKKYFAVNLSLLSVMTAMIVAYSIGEGLGRLACISFGCCYGRKLELCSSFTRKVFKNINFIFTGKLKKISYAHQWEGKEVIPVQAMTAVIYIFSGLIGMYLFFRGFVLLPLLLNLFITQLWRILSEFMRADYRGEGKISGYQIMALLSIIYGLIIIYLFKNTDKDVRPDLIIGLNTVCDPFIIIFMIALGSVVFIYTGKSKVTDSTINFKIIEKNI